MITDGSVLGNDHMSVESQLLHSGFQGFKLVLQFYQNFVSLTSIISGYVGHFCLQILHTGSHHWVAVETVSSSKAYIYNNLYKQQPVCTLKQLATSYFKYFRAKSGFIISQITVSDKFKRLWGIHSCLCN